MTTPNTATAAAEPEVIDSTPAVITDTTTYKGALQRWTGSYNVLTPFTNMSGILPSFGLIASVVKLNPNPVAGEVYGNVPWLKNGETAPAKVGLRKLAECAGISTHTERTDPRTIPHYWEFRAIARYRGLDGSIIERSATYEWDLRDGSDRMKGWTPKQVEEGRKHGLRNCEARAINAAIRECGCGIKQKYTTEELAKPFVVVRVAFQPDMNDPAVKAMVTSQALAGTQALYPPLGGAPALGAGSDVVDDVAPRQVGGGPANPNPATPPAEPAKPQLPEGFGLLKKLEVKQVNRKAPKTGTFPKWFAVDYQGAEHVTINREFGGSLDKLWNNGNPTVAVEIVSEVNGYNENEISEINVHGEPAQQGLPDPSKL